MDYEKILESLKICSKVGTSCDGCSGMGERHCIANLTKAAAIAIETLLHALDMAKRERDVVSRHMIELEQEVCRLKSRLAEYEDTGLEPEDIKEHEAAYNECLTRTYGPFKQKISQWLQAEQDGRLVVLPCKVGDTVYTVHQVGRCQMKIYLAGKISGDPGYREKFARWQDKLEKDGATVLNPANNPEGLSKADYMRLSFAMIDAADAVAFLPDAEESPGAQLERLYCEYIGKPFASINHLDGGVGIERR